MRNYFIPEIEHMRKIYGCWRNVTKGDGRPFVDRKKMFWEAKDNRLDFLFLPDNVPYRRRVPEHTNVHVSRVIAAWAVKASELFEIVFTSRL